MQGMEFSISIKVDVNKSSVFFNYSLSIILNLSGEARVWRIFYSNFISVEFKN
jgi:hypothetical protein